MSDNLAFRWMRRYKVFFLIGLLILGIQIFLAYKSLNINEPQLAENLYQASSAGQNANIFAGNNRNSQSNHNNQNSVSDDEESAANNVRQGRAAAAAVPLPESKNKSVTSTTTHVLTAKMLGFQPTCDINAKEAISALQRARSTECRQHIARIACAIQAGEFYARELRSSCPAGNRTALAPLGCYRDEKEFRLLPGYFTNFKSSNTPQRCQQLCLQSGYTFAGVQYGSECFCGNDAPLSSAKLADSSCNMKCSGDGREVCGGYFSMNVYETGIAKFTARIAETSVKPDVQRVRIAFLLTLNGRALRQVHRLIRALYAPQHFFFIHVDARQDYLYRKLLELEPNFSNIRLARTRFSTIWGGASLLTMLLQCMQELLDSDWPWDFVINLSESDFPVKTVDKLADFLSANRGRNFVKSHGRETQRFIQKQGLDKTFVECDTHMWRIGDRQLPRNIQVDGGSDWVALSRPFVKYVTNTASDEEDYELLLGLRNIFRHTLLPAESFFHTVLRNSRFCDTYVDNNLHVTNWKRKLGCKCQYKHVVDWCGCSPNDFKPDDWQRLQGTEHKMLYFARKFEPIINQAIVLQLEEWLFGPYTSEFFNLHAYWQSLYHAADKQADDLTLTIADSLLRTLTRKLTHFRAPAKLREITNFLSNDQYKGFLLRYIDDGLNGTYSEYETRIRPVQYIKLAKNSKFARRLRNFEVSSEFDQKEQISRNYAKLLGPHTELVLSFTFAGAGTHATESHSYNLTALWIDPAGQLQDYTELHIEDAQTDAINYSKAVLKQPLTPGIWTVKLIGRSAIFAQTKFLVAPLAYDGGGRRTISTKRAQILNLGAALSEPPLDFTLPSEWQQHLPPAEDVRVLRELAEANAQRSGASLQSWIDELVSKFFHIRETCVSAEITTLPAVSTAALTALPRCKDTAWSSLTADPKSDINDLLKRR